MLTAAPWIERIGRWRGPTPCWAGANRGRGRGDRQPRAVVRRPACWRRRRRRDGAGARASPRPSMSARPRSRWPVSVMVPAACAAGAHRAAAAAAAARAPRRGSRGRKTERNVAPERWTPLPDARRAAGRTASPPRGRSRRRRCRRARRTRSDTSVPTPPLGVRLDEVVQRGHAVHEDAAADQEHRRGAGDRKALHQPAARPRRMPRPSARCSAAPAPRCAVRYRPTSSSLTMPATRP